jgi:D-beta-D-heptose 7-phosphate kinase/D-beta-D-heptose 1-phosphate adenosyltransferase
MGDIMIDINTYVSITKIANEAPIPVFNILDETYVLGGAGNVLKNLVALGCLQIYAFGIVGNDINESRIRKLCSDSNIIDCIKTLPDYKTIVKHRYFCDNKIVFRCDTEVSSRTTHIPTDIVRSQLETLCQNGLDCIILSDYNKGFLTPEICQLIIQTANKYNIITIVDPKEDYRKYIGCTLIKPNRREAYHIFNIPSSTSLEEVHKIIKSKIGCIYSVITLAEDGMSVSTPTGIIKTVAQSQQVIDVTGAGDIVTSIFAYFLAKSTPIAAIAKIATHIATISVQHSGTYTIQTKDLCLCELEQSSKIIQADQLSLINTIYASNKIVFTNGCFDMLHNGHVEVFKFCKQKGDIVVVGLNSDASIARLKGPSRPIYPLTARLQILEAISYIDYIVVFEDDTPIELIKALNPYFLIKGGDYAPETIIGHEYATETIVCNFVNGVSTTNTIKKIILDSITPIRSP